MVRPRRDPCDPAADERKRDEHEDHGAHPVADPERDATAGLGRKRPQHVRDLAGGAAGAGGLDCEHVLEVGDQLGVVGIAVLHALGGRGVDDRGERGGHLRTLGLHVRELLAHVLHRDRHLVLPPERDLAGEHLVEHDAERVQVRLAGHGTAEGLLGRDVVGRAEDPAVRGESLLVQCAGDPEVGDLGRALLVDQDVLGLDVTVDDVTGMRHPEGASDLDRVRDRLGRGQAAGAADPLLERLALDVLEHDVRPAVVLSVVDHPDDVRMRQLRHRPRLPAEALELVGVGGDLAVHQLDRDLALQRLVGGPVDRRHPACPDPGLESVAAVERGAEQRAHGLPSILREIAVVHTYYYTDPLCPWSWALEPALRKLSHELAGSVSVTYVMCGIARQFGDPVPLVAEMLEAADRSGMPVDPRLWLTAPPRSSHPACLAVKAVSEQGDPAPYLRRLREGLMCRRRKLDSTDALIEEARAVPDVDLEKLRLALHSHATVEAFGADLDRAAAVPAEHHAPGTGRVKLPSLEFRGGDGVVHGVYGFSDYASLAAAAIAAGAQPAGDGSPAVSEALRVFGSMATAEVATVCDLAGPRAPAELWRLATEWRVRPDRVGSGELWTLA